MTMYRWERGWMITLAIFFLAGVALVIIFPPNKDCGWNELEVGMQF